MLKTVVRMLTGVCLVMALLGSTGCVAIKGKDLAQIGPLADQHAAYKKSISLDASYTVNGKSGRGNSALKKKQLELAEKTLKESGLFNRIVLGHGKEPTDYRLTYQVNEDANMVLGAVSGFICGYTFGLIPGGAAAHHTVTATLENGYGTFLGSKVYRNKTTMVIWLPLIPAMLSDNLNFFTSSEEYMMNYYRHSVIDLMPEYPKTTRRTALAQ